MKLYSVLLPPIAEPYVRKEPKIEDNGKADSIKHVIYDPLRREKVNYSIHGYRTGSILTPKSSQRIVLQEHVAKYLNSPKGIEFARSQNADGFPVLSTSFAVKDPKNPSSFIAIKLRATYAKDYLMVQEVVASKVLMQSRFVTHLLAHTLFHPQDAHEKLNADNSPEEKADASEATKKPPEPAIIEAEQPAAAN